MKGESGNIASLIKSLDHPDKRIIRGAIDSLLAAEIERPEIRESLDRLLGDPSRKTRWPLAYTLAQLSAASSRCLDVLIESLGHKDAEIRWAVCLLLVRLEKSDRRIVPLLLNALKTGDPVERRMAVYCLRDVGLSGKGVRRAVEESLRDPSPLVRVAAVIALVRQSEIGQGGLDVLASLSSDDADPRVRHAAAFALRRLGLSAERGKKEETSGDR